MPNRFDRHRTAHGARTAHRRDQRRVRDGEREREPTPVVVRYECPDCGGPHPRSACNSTLDGGTDG